MCSCNKRSVEVASSYTPSYNRGVKKPTFSSTKKSVSNIQEKKPTLQNNRPKANKNLELYLKSKKRSPPVNYPKPTKFPNMKR